MPVDPYILYMIRLGYAGINTELPTSGRTFRLSGYSRERMLDTAFSNICALERILHWNRDHRIGVFRITSGLIPFGSHPVNSGEWKQAFRSDFARIGRFIRENGMRVSMHPGQHTVINTPDESYYASVLKDLDYHTAVLDLMGLSPENRIIVHGGGGYKDKEKSSKLLKDRLASLPPAVRERLALENDERVFRADEILAVCRETGLPGVLDVFHHEVLPSFGGRETREIILLFQQTWQGLRQKIHYSDQAPGKRRGSHSGSIDISGFGNFIGTVDGMELDIMLETKDKQASVLALRKAFPDLG